MIKVRNFHPISHVNLIIPVFDKEYSFFLHELTEYKGAVKASKANKISQVQFSHQNVQIEGYQLSEGNREWNVVE
jgi:hypothetical protein